MITVRRSEDRWPTDLGWLRSRHTFSFGNYHDPAHMGVSVLRVINDDRVEPGQGFATHSHRDMEIISYVKRGVIEHRDSMGHVERLPAGEIQLMSAGTGVTHSEYNASQTEPLEFLQIWILPAVGGIEPGYQQRRFERRPGVRLVISPDGADGSLRIHQDATMSHVLLEPGQKVGQPFAAGRTAYVHVVEGSIDVAGEMLSEGDGATLAGLTELGLEARTSSEALLFDLP